MAYENYSLSPSSSSGDGRRNNPGNPNQPRDENGQFISREEANRKGHKGGSSEKGNR